MLLFGYYLFMKHTGLGIPCPIRYFFHIQCPGCGISHMLLSLLQGNYRKAFFYHPVIFVSLPFLTYLIVKMLYGYLFAKRSMEPDRKCRYNPFDLRFDPIYSLSQSGNLPIKDCFSILPMIKYKIYFLVYSSFEKGRKL